MRIPFFSFTRKIRVGGETRHKNRAAHFRMHLHAATASPTQTDARSLSLTSVVDVSHTRARARTHAAPATFPRSLTSARSKHPKTRAGRRRASPPILSCSLMTSFLLGGVIIYVYRESKRSEGRRSRGRIKQKCFFGFFFSSSQKLGKILEE